VRAGALSGARSDCVQVEVERHLCKRSRGGGCDCTEPRKDAWLQEAPQDYLRAMVPRGAAHGVHSGLGRST